jgi:ATP-dependent exoDNAse (exonuclease V) beta subunit
MPEVKRISFSELKNWKECTYRHKLIHIDKVSYFEGNEYTAFGTAMHHCCEQVVADPSKNAHDIFENKFLQELKELKEQNKTLKEDLVKDMRAQAKHICDKILPELSNYFGNFSIVSVEEELMEPIDEFQSYGRNFKGFIDLTIKTSDGKYHIIDWKTCSWGWDSRKKADPMTNYQLTYYKNYFAKKHNISPQDISTYFILLKRTAKKDNVEVVKTTSGFKKTQNSLKLLENAVINIEKGTQIKNRLSCKYCKFHKTEYCK